MWPKRFFIIIIIIIIIILKKDSCFTKQNFILCTQLSIDSWYVAQFSLSPSEYTEQELLFDYNVNKDKSQPYNNCVSVWIIHSQRVNF